MRHDATRALYGYWNELRGSRRVPRRLEIQPSRLGAHLLDTFILERTGRSFVFRLAGTRVSSWFGTDLRARNFLASWGEGDRAMLERHFMAITELGRVGLFTGEGTYASGSGTGQAPRTVPFELVVLPLMHTGHTIDRLLCLLVPLDDANRRIESPVQGIKLLAAEEIWPDGKPRTIRAPAEPAPALHPHVRTARIVRDGRRQFRVYQGGRVADEADPKTDRPPTQ